MSWGICLWEPKFEENWGTVVRSAFNFKVDYLVTVGSRYKRTPSDTVNGTKHIPVFHYQDMKEFLKYAAGSGLVVVERDGNISLPTYQHPSSALYVFGGEDRSVPRELPGVRVVIPTFHCLNLAVAASIVMYDRMVKGCGRITTTGG